MADLNKSHVLLTEKIKRWIRTVLLTESLPNDTREELLKYTKNRRNPEEKKARTIPFELVKTVHKHLESEQGGLYLHELLEGSDINHPGVELPPRNPELEARIERLKAEQANREYAAMTRNVDAQAKQGIKDPSIGKEIQGLNRQLIAIFNCLLTVIGSFAFAYKAVEYSMEKPCFEMQLGAGLIVGTVVFFADLYFLIKYEDMEKVN